MPIEGLGDVSERLEEITGRFIAAQEGVQSALDTGAPSEGELEALRASLQGVLDDLRSLVRDLDQVDELAFLLVDDGRRTVQAWQWRRRSRRALLQFIGLARRALDVARELVGGQHRRVVVSREGDTLQRIAARELGDWQAWPRLLAANPDLEPGTLAPGTSLVVPEKR